jgi:hypothetical protein
MILQSDSDSTENHFSRETETFLFLSESGTVPNTPSLSVYTLSQLINENEETSN